MNQLTPFIREMSQKIVCYIHTHTNGQNIDTFILFLFYTQFLKYATNWNYSSHV